jgi:cytochrome c551/c552
MFVVLRAFCVLVVLSMIGILAPEASAKDSVSAALAKEKGCMSCHEGIEQFTDGPMMEQIMAMGEDYGDKGGCVVCHGGNPAATTAEAAHSGAPKELTDADGPHTFYPDPGSIFIGDRACGQCHQGYSERLMKSLMNTEAGKLQGNYC